VWITKLSLHQFKNKTIYSREQSFWEASLFLQVTIKKREREMTMLPTFSCRPSSLITISSFVRQQRICVSKFYQIPILSDNNVTTSTDHAGENN